jgi:hypothetical protein
MCDAIHREFGTGLVAIAGRIEKSPVWEIIDSSQQLLALSRFLALAANSERV